MAVYLHEELPSHPKMLKALAVDERAGWLWIAALCWSRQHKTSGSVPAPALPMLTRHRRPVQLADVLVDVGLWERDGDDYRIHDYEEHQWTEERAKKAAAARWSRHRPPPDASADAQASTSAPATAGASAHALPNPTPNPSELPHPELARSASNGRGGGSKSKNGKAGDLVATVAGACSGTKRTVVEAEAATVVAHLAAHVDRRLIEEAAGQAREAGANLPRWLLPNVRARAAQYGVQVPPHPTLEASS